MTETAAGVPPALRYIEVTADLPVRGVMRQFTVWVDLLSVATALGPKALAAKAGVSIDVRGAVRVTVRK